MQHYGVLAYQRTTKAVESPREREAALLIKAAASLQNIRDTWPNHSQDLSEALTFNRKLWTIFMTSVTRDDNPLPKDVRQNIANLGIFILNQTREIMNEPASQKLDVLVNLNRQIAAGLRSMPN